MLFAWILLSILFDFVVIMFIDLVRRVVTALKDGMDRAVDRFGRNRKGQLTVCMHESSKPEYVYTPDYFDVAVQVNESMLSKPGKHDREFSLLPSDDRKNASRKTSKPVIHQDSRRPEVIPEEVLDHGHVVKDHPRRSSFTTEPKPALKDSSRSSSSAESLSSGKPASDIRSSSSKKVSWERLSMTNEDEKLTHSTSGSTTPQGRASTGGPKIKVDEKASSQVLELLSEPNQAAFETFRKLCAKNGLLDRPVGFSDRDLPEGVNDDATLFRFFTARKCDIHAAYDQFQDAHVTREANDVLGFSKRMDVDDFEESRKLYPEWVGRRDKRGLPICIFDFTKFSSKMINTHKKASPSIYGMNLDTTAEHAVSPDLLRAFVVFDSLTRFILPLCSGTPGGPDPVHKTLHLVDITGIGIRQIQDLSRLLSRNYPEILDNVFLIGAPSYFSTIWGWVKNWVDPGTVEKLKVLSHAEVLPTLKEYIDVENIPTRFGGQLKYETGMGYDLDPVITRRLVWLSGSDNKFPKGPITWVRTGDGCKMAVAIGSQHGKERMKKLAVIR
ncbi:MAG: hypothetical protein LQ352_005225 [Teloschistes flavicans]|nr:MAG: hypothetical protein LQ352_005225 [Teloschistes flavicans]